MVKPWAISPASPKLKLSLKFLSRNVYDLRNKTVVNKLVDSENIHPLCKHIKYKHPVDNAIVIDHKCIAFSLSFFKHLTVIYRELHNNVNDTRDTNL